MLLKVHVDVKLLCVLVPLKLFATHYYYKVVIVIKLIK